MSDRRALHEQKLREISEAQSTAAGRERLADAAWSGMGPIYPEPGTFIDFALRDMKRLEARTGGCLEVNDEKEGRR